MAQIASYIRIDDIPGGCRESEHKDWMQMEHFMHGVEQQATHRPGGGGGSMSAGESRAKECVVRMHLDRAFPTLLKSCTLGMHHDTAEVDFHKAGTDKQRYLKYKFKNVLVTDVQIVAETQGDDAFPIVEYTFAYSTMSIEYSPTQVQGGGVSGSIMFEYDWEARA